MSTKALVVLSGGQDSSTCLAFALSEMEAGAHSSVSALTFNYGQRHSIEVTAAREMIAALQARGIEVAHEVVDLSKVGVLKGTSPLVNPASAVEHYADAESLPGGLEKTFVPMRNALFIAIAANRAACMATDANEEVTVYLGVSQEDYGGYPDCRAGFIAAMGRAVDEALDSTEMPCIDLNTPLLTMTKAQTVELAEALPLGRFLNSFSRTCYEGQHPPCGKCHACLLRAKGYKEAGVSDPAIPG